MKTADFLFVIYYFYYLCGAVKFVFAVDLLKKERYVLIL